VQVGVVVLVVLLELVGWDVVVVGETQRAEVQHYPLGVTGVSNHLTHYFTEPTNE